MGLSWEFRGYIMVWIMWYARPSGIRKIGAESGVYQHVCSLILYWYFEEYRDL